MLMPFPSSQMQVLGKNIEGTNLVSKPGKTNVFHVLFSAAVQEHDTPSCTPEGSTEGESRVIGNGKWRKGVKA